MTVPTNDRLAAIHLTDTHNGSRCGQPDSLQHRIMDCKEGPTIWNWTREKLGLILRMDPRHIPRTWPLRPDFHYWPTQRQADLLWTVAHLVYYRLQIHRCLSLREFMDFLQRAPWKAHRARRAPLRGNPVLTRVLLRLHRQILPSTTDKNPPLKP